MKTQEEIKAYIKGMNDPFITEILEVFSTYKEKELKEALNKYSKMDNYFKRKKLYLISFKNQFTILRTYEQFLKFRDVLRWIVG